jgi:hypothetical protein
MESAAGHVSALGHSRPGRSSAPAQSLYCGQRSPRYDRSRGGLTSKIRTVLDTNGLPVRLGLTPGEAHDNRLCSVSSARFASTNDVARGSWIRCGLDQAACPPARGMGEHSAETKSQTQDQLQPAICIVHAISLNGSSTRSSSGGGLRPDTISSLPTIWRSSNSHQFEFGCVPKGSVALVFA